MKFAIFALSAIIFTSCTDTLNMRRKEFSPSKGKGPWTNYANDIEEGRDPSLRAKKEK